MKLITYKYFWTTDDSTSIQLRILTDTEEGHTKFVNSVKQISGLTRFAREYVSEITLDLFTGIETLYIKENENDKTLC
ncbi:hypothetical protein [Microvirus mar34]|uniref:Uncharacterized protein n=1 Tax=Microvirus mar34 TaxID=2851168 RepID=A0A8F5ML36_9VIRU|nr:hypothetical protein [Microvirus mar34]